MSHKLSQHPLLSIFFRQISDETSPLGTPMSKLQTDP